MPGDNNVNGKKLNLCKAKRARIQQYKVSKNNTPHQQVANTNAEIIPTVELVVQATAKRREMLLLKDKPSEDNTVKIVSGIRPGRMGKNGVMMRPTRVNKKKVKKMLKRDKNWKASILAAVSQVDVEMA